MEHLVIHLTNEAILGGPVQFRWMYPYERKLGRLKRMIRNKWRIEGSIVESNLVDELSNYCSLYLELPVREPRNFAPNISCSSSTDLRLSIFKHPSRRLYEKHGEDKVLLEKDRDKAHTYILLNCEEVLESVRLFDEELRDLFPNYNKAILDEIKDLEFAKWFQNHDDNNASDKHFFQENERIEYTVAEDLFPISFVHEDGSLEEVEDADDDNDEVVFEDFEEEESE
ncbi:hypothetical protein QVD17_24787 [Tagetes erecta]|uniref:DUF4218 domain-containing protein n=1 Tax=Tagetes erecta TaxID=13708 RepID=A0AAD8NMX0_TARER|nr:hypothetical protein QVD17_24787 [Tagetes erecta]